MIAPRVYMASKVRHAWRWRALRADGLAVISTWIDCPDKLDEAGYRRLWRRCVGEASMADATILYAEPGEVLKGGLIEAGAALASGKMVIQVGSCASLEAGEGSDASFTRHPRWRRADSLIEAIELLTSVRPFQQRRAALVGAALKLQREVG